jgi:hypothetical protein
LFSLRWTTVRLLKLRMVRRGTSFGAVASELEKGEMSFSSTSASNLVHENYAGGTSSAHEAEVEESSDTHRIALVDLGLCDVEPARSHDLVVDDEALEGGRS